MSRFSISFALSIVLAAPPIAHASPADRPQRKPTANCFGPLKAALDRGGFLEGTKCAGYQRFALDYAGKTSPPHVFQVYSLRYITVPPKTVPWGRGGQRILLFNARGDYLGQYHVGGFYRVWVSGHSVHTNGLRKWGNVFRLDTAEPPPQVHLDGDIVGLDK